MTAPAALSGMVHSSVKGKAIAQYQAILRLITDNAKALLAVMQYLI
jgi:hypothetical protein